MRSIIMFLLAVYIPLASCYLSGSKDEENLMDLHKAFYYINNDMVLNNEKDVYVSSVASKYIYRC